MGGKRKERERYRKKTHPLLPPTGQCGDPKVNSVITFFSFDPCVLGSHLYLICISNVSHLYTYTRVYVLGRPVMLACNRILKALNKDNVLYSHTLGK